MASFTSPITFVAGLVTSVMLNRLNTMIAELQGVANSSAPANIVLSGGATAGSVTPAARKISGTRVGLEGVVSSVSVGSSVNIGTIPAGRSRA